MRYIGVDLHKTNFVVCFLNEDETYQLETFPLSKTGINRFTSRLSKDDAVAVEVTQNIYYFYDQIKTHVARVVLVDTYRFAIIASSKKKTDKADAQARASFFETRASAGSSRPIRKSSRSPADIVRLTLRFCN